MYILPLDIVTTATFLQYKCRLLKSKNLFDVLLFYMDNAAPMCYIQLKKALNMYNVTFIMNQICLCWFVILLNKILEKHIKVEINYCFSYTLLFFVFITYPYLSFKKNSSELLLLK